jgi:uncharacterized protein YbjT (DUF2867 family)
VAVLKLVIRRREQEDLMILITGATGTVGREVVRALSGTGQTFMVMVRSEVARERLERAGIPIVATDCDEPAHLTKIVTTFTLELSDE